MQPEVFGFCDITQTLKHVNVMPCTSTLQDTSACTLETCVPTSFSSSKMPREPTKSAHTVHRLRAGPTPGSNLNEKFEDWIKHLSISTWVHFSRYPLKNYFKIILTARIIRAGPRVGPARHLCMVCALLVSSHRSVLSLFYVVPKCTQYIPQPDPTTIVFLLNRAKVRLRKLVPRLSMLLESNFVL